MSSRAGGSRLRLRPAERRAVHPGAWWLWAGGLAAVAMRTTNVVLLALLLAVVAYVVAARRSSAPWSRSFTSFLKLGLVVVALRMLLTVLFGARLPGTVVFTIPTVELPSWMAGVHLGGEVTVPMLVQAFAAGFRLAVLLAVFGALNSLCSPYRMLRSLPAVLYEAGVAVTVALAFAPQAVTSLGRLRDARRLRGRPTRGLHAVRGLALPVLEGALDRSVSLAASMDARGYGRRGDASVRARAVAAVATAVGLLAVCVGLYAVLDAGAPRSLGLPVLGIGSALLAAALFAGGRRSTRTRYRPDPWAGPEWAIAASGVVALAGSLVAGATDPGSLQPALVPLTWPGLAWPAVVGILAGLVPAVVAPLPPTVGGEPVDLVEPVESLASVEQVESVEPVESLASVDPAAPVARSSQAATEAIHGVAGRSSSPNRSASEPSDAPTVDAAAGIGALRIGAVATPGAGVDR